MAIVVEDGVTESRPCSETEIVRLCSVCLRSAETKSDRSLPRSFWLRRLKTSLSNIHNEYIEDFAGSTDLISCIGPITEEAEYKEVQDLPNSEDNHNDIADLEFEAELVELLYQVCNLENLEYINNAEVEVVETKRPFLAQLATIFTIEIKSAKEGQVKEKKKINSVKKSNDKANIEIKSTRGGRVKEKMKVNSAEKLSDKAESAIEDQKQIKAKHNDPTPRLHKKSMPTPSRQELNPPSQVGQSSQRPKSCRHTYPNQDGQDLKSLTENPSSPPPPMELKPLPNHLKYAYLGSKQQLPVIIANNLHQEQEDKLLEVLRQHKKVIGWNFQTFLA
ncbi:hypothetical protein CR513_01132, partial [Mucuna pruriens]